MTMTTRVLSVTDQDAALRFYTVVLGCELRTEVEVWPGARMVEVVPPAGVTLHNDDLVRMEGVPPMFSFADPDGNGLVYLEDGGPAS